MRLPCKLHWQQEAAAVTRGSCDKFLSACKAADFEAVATAMLLVRLSIMALLTADGSSLWAVTAVAKGPCSLCKTCGASSTRCRRSSGEPTRGMQRRVVRVCCLWRSPNPDRTGARKAWFSWRLWALRAPPPPQPRWIWQRAASAWADRTRPARLRSSRFWPYCHYMSGLALLCSPPFGICMRCYDSSSAAVYNIP